MVQRQTFLWNFQGYVVWKIYVFSDLLKNLQLRFLKAGRFERVSLTGNSHPIVTRGSRVSRAPHPSRRLPRFSESSWYVNSHAFGDEYLNDKRWTVQNWLLLQLFANILHHQYFIKEDKNNFGNFSRKFVSAIFVKILFWKFT